MFASTTSKRVLRHRHSPGDGNVPINHNSRGNEYLYSRPQPQGMNPSYDDISALLQQHLDKVETTVRSTVQDEVRNMSTTLSERQQGCLGMIRKLLSLCGFEQTSCNDYDVADSPSLPANHELEEQCLQMTREHVEEVNSLILQLKQKDAKLVQTKQQAAAEHQALGTQLADQRRKNHALTEKITKFRHMLVQPPASYVIDSDVIQEFGFLRSQILKFVKSTFEARLSADRFQPAMTDHQKIFFHQFKIEEWPESYFINRIRGAVFHTIWDRILSQTFVEPHGSPDEDRLHSALEYLDVSFRNTLLKENMKEFVDWRMASVKCSSLLAGSTNAARDTASTIWSFLKPVAIKPDMDEKGKALLLKLCEDALELNSQLTSSRDVFEVRRDFEGPLETHVGYADEDAIEELGKLKETSGEPGHIACCIFGALVKLTEEDPSKEIVLEKASVVVYKG
ncbi:hypothetical protein F4677DRAFT_424143 [Hypoxylon crocopeplum]|nr:hypothetical protein F4677DRAFT_424143 [Hypoxylon crocopeplum]